MQLPKSGRHISATKNILIDSRLFSSNEDFNQIHLSSATLDTTSSPDNQIKRYKINIEEIAFFLLAELTSHMDARGKPNSRTKLKRVLCNCFAIKNASTRPNLSARHQQRSAIGARSLIPERFFFFHRKARIESIRWPRENASTRASNCIKQIALSIPLCIETSQLRRSQHGNVYFTTVIFRCWSLTQIRIILARISISSDRDRSWRANSIASAYTR